MTAATVAVIIPVHNAEQYLTQTLESVYQQSLPQHRITIIAVDDGSTDDSLAILRAHSREHDNLVVISQAASGSPSGPRNVGIERATDEYVFFLDSDDLLTPRALQRMLDVAVEQDADVVLCKMDSLNGRRGVPRSMFAESRMDADVIEHRLYHALGPTKLFRRGHLLQNELRFPTELRVGEDKPFVAAALLTARRICVVADEAYYLVRERDDPSAHLGRASETSTEAVLKAELLAAVIERHTEAGERRDTLMQRAFGGSFQGAFRRKFVLLSPSEREALTERARASMGHLWTDGARQHVQPYGRVVLDLAFDGRVAELVELEQWRASHEGRLVRGEQGRWVLHLPDAVVAAVHGADAAIAVPGVDYRLTGMRADGDSLLVQGWAGVVGGAQPPDSVLVRLERRGSADVVEMPANLAGVITTTESTAARFVIDIRPAALPADGVWDVSLVLTSDRARSARQRFGSRRDTGVRSEVVIGDLAVAYFTATYSNLSLDRGFTKVARPSDVVVVGADRGPAGQPVLYVDSGPLRAHEVRIRVELSAHSASSPGGTSSTAVLGPALLAVVLPEPAQETDVRLTTITAGRETTLTMPPGLVIPPHPTAARASVVDGVVRVGPGPRLSRRSPAVWAVRGKRGARRAAGAVVRRLPAPVAAAARRVRDHLR